jgi:hypothetical protein
VADLEPLRGQAPVRALDRHPDGRHVALATGWGPADGEDAGVWDEQTGKVVWAPRAVALCWLRGGSEVALVTEQYSGDFERWSWPGRERLSGIPLVHREGWVDHVAVSPRDDLAAVRWIDQTEAGFELVSLGRGGDAQLKGRGWRVGGTNLVEGPVFSPSGRFLALSVGLAGWWRRGDDVDGPSEGGRFEAGQAAVFDTKDGSAHDVPIELDVPAGWEPESEEAQVGLLGEPRFVTAQSFVVPLPTGEELRLSVGATASRGRRRPSSAR